MYLCVCVYMYASTEYEMILYERKITKFYCIFGSLLKGNSAFQTYKTS